LIVADIEIEFLKVEITSASIHTALHDLLNRNGNSKGSMLKLTIQ
jgi:hypothetical protein